MDRAYIDINLVNFVTVIVMVVVFYAVIGSVVSLVRNYVPKEAAS